MAEPDFTISVERIDGELLVIDGLALARGFFTGDPSYGLFLVEQLTQRWGMTREDERTRVWFEIDYRAAADSQP